MSDYLPKDVLVEILTRLPIKSLVRCTGVCKSWEALIASPAFMSIHQKSAADAAPPLLFVRHYDMFDKIERYALHYDDEAFEEFMELSCSVRIRSQYFRIVGSCNGLICLSDDLDKYTNTIVLWNPSIRKRIKIPEPRLVYHQGRGSCLYGFGFDSSANDFKVVRIVYNTNDEDGYEFEFPPSREFLDRLKAIKFTVPPGVEVYSMNTGTWRDISDGSSPDYILSRNHFVSPYVHGSVHWVASNDNDDSDHSGNNSSGTSNGFGTNSFVSAFDMSREVFREIELPDCVAHKMTLKLALMAMDGCLALIEYEKFWQSDYCWVWAMKEYGVAKSWTKMYNIDMRGGLRNVVGFRGNGEIMVSARVVGMISYDPVKKLAKYLGIHGTNRSFYAESYVESLALVRTGNRNFVADQTTSGDVESALIGSRSDVEGDALVRTGIRNLMTQQTTSGFGESELIGSHNEIQEDGSKE